MKRRPGHLLAAALAAALAVPAAAFGHVTISPSLVRPGVTEVFTFAVENDRIDAPMVSLEITAPAGARVIGVREAPPWISRRTSGGAAFAGARIPPKETRRFALRVTLPRTADGTLEFTIAERFSDGPGPDQKAAVVVARDRPAADSGSRFGAASLAIAVAIGLGAGALGAFLVLLGRRRSRA